jgi:hypothetical protein
MRLTLFNVALTLILSPLCRAQGWEVGGVAGYGAYSNATIVNNIGESASAGFHRFYQGWAVGAVLTEDPYNYIGGEVRYLFQSDSPELRFQGTRATISGYSNLVVYDFLIHMRPQEKRLRPYVAAGGGVKVYTGSNPLFLTLTQPLVQFAVLRPCTQVEPAVSLGGGVKYRVKRHVWLRADFRTYMTPLPDDLFRTTARLSAIRGWLYDFVPQLGVSYTFYEEH